MKTSNSAASSTTLYGLLGLGCLLLAFVAQVASQRFLFADGAHFLVDMLLEHGFASWDYPRQYAHYLTQWPVALALALGVRSVACLGTLYGASLFSVPLVTLALCAWLAPAGKRAYALLLLPAFVYTQLNSGLFVISESHLAAGLFFVVLFFVLLCDRPSPAQAAVAALSAVASVRVYESYALLGPALSALALERWARGRPGALHVRVALAIIAAAGVAAAGMGLYWMIWSERNVAQVGLGQIAVQLLSDFNFLVSSLAALGFGAAWLLPARFRAPRGSLAAGAALGALLGLLPLASDGFIPARLHYPARVLNIVVPLAGMGLLLWERRRAFPGAAGPSRAAATLLCGLLAWNTVWQVAASGAWWQYTRTVAQALRDHAGVVPVQDTPLDGQVLNVHWALPSLSIVVSAMEGQRTVPALIEPGREGWQPFNPNRCAELPKLDDYGIGYAFCPVSER